MQPAFGTSQKYNEPLLFDSRNERYKLPFGSVGTGQSVFISFPVSVNLNAAGVTLFVRRNDYIVHFKLNFTGTSDGYDRFETTFTPERDGTYFYRFEIYHKDGGVSYVGKANGSRAIIGEWLPEWQLSVYQSDYNTPDWFKGGVVYHIFSDRFNNKDNPSLPRYGVMKKWDEDVTIVDPDGVYRANDFYGGNFNGIAEKLDYLYDLGVTALYLSPIFESSSNHRYDTGDYEKLDSLLGTYDDFINLVKKAKEKNISIILDGVFNHTGADSKYFNKLGRYGGLGAYQSKSSRYYDWFTFINYPDEYRCWWGIKVVPTVSRDARGFHELIAGDGGVIEKWTKTGIKGWRLDVVDELSESFVKKIRKKIKATDPEALVIGEVWEDASTKVSYGEEREYFRGDDLDGVMNYVFKDAILRFVCGGSGEEFAEATMNIIENYPKQSLDVCFTLIDSHDTVRALNALSGANGGETKWDRKDYRLTPEEYEKGKRLLKIASAIQYFLPGVPSLYYGDEIGSEGFEDPLNRRTFKWDKMDEDLLSHYKYLGSFRREHREKFCERAYVYGEGSKVVIVRKSMIFRADRADGVFRVEFTEP